MQFVMLILRFLIGAALAGICMLSFAAFLGFANPLLDALNHFQPILFFGTLTMLALVLLFFNNHSWRAGLVALGATGFLASAVIVVPEQLGSFFKTQGPQSDQQVVKIMSHNLFGLNYDMARMASVIGEQDPDIIAFQEYFEEQQERLHPQIIADYPYFATCAGRKHSYVALYSKTPFSVVNANTQCAVDAAQENNPVARLVAKFTDRDESEFTLVTTHLNWPVQINPLFKDDMDVGQKLVAMTARKRTEWAELSAAIEQIEGPILLAGDLNSTSWSYAMGAFVRETGLIRHSHGLLTYPKIYYIRGWRELPAFLPIDHIMASKDIQVQSVVTGEKTGSDHLPLYAYFQVTGVSP